MEKEFDFKNIGKRMPYRTPDGFFGKMQNKYWSVPRLRGLIGRIE